MEVDGEIARKIANEGEYAFSIWFSKHQEVDLDNGSLKTAADSIKPRIKISLTGEFALRIVAPETKETIEKAKKRCADCKKNQPIIFNDNLFSKSFFYADDYYDYAIRFPRYFVERSTLSEIARKRSLQIEKEEDVIEC